jgi:hypothetical protein
MRYAIKATREEIASLGDISIVYVQIPDLNDFANVINKSRISKETFHYDPSTIPAPVIPFPSPTPKEKERDCEPEGEVCFHTDGTVSLTVTNPCIGLGIEVASNGAVLAWCSVNTLSDKSDSFFGEPAYWPACTQQARSGLGFSVEKRLTAKSSLILGDLGRVLPTTVPSDLSKLRLKFYPRRLPWNRLLLKELPRT